MPSAYLIESDVSNLDLVMVYTSSRNHSAAIIMSTVYYIKEIPTLINILAPQACSLVQDVDECFAKFNLQGFYKASHGIHINVVLKS